VDDAGIEDDAFTGGEPTDTFAECGHHAGSVGSEDARLRDGGKAFSNPDVEAVQRRGPQLDEHLAWTGLGVRDLLEPEHLRPPVLVNAHGPH
jgi:hypothetical protein